MIHCNYCLQESVKLSHCSRCKSAAYCGPACQKSAWKTHQMVCFPEGLMPKEHEIVCSFSDASGIRPITQREFKALLGVPFLHHSYFPKKTLTACQEGREMPDAIDSVAIQHQGDLLGYSLVATRKIAARTIICSFGGRVWNEADWDAKRHSNRAALYAITSNEYVFDVSAQISLGAIVNDGPPNCEWKTLNRPIEFKGLQIPFEKVLFSVQEIAPGETLCTDYGWSHGVKNGRYQLPENTLNRLVRKYENGLNFSLLKETGLVLTASDEKTFMATELVYIATTPYVLALLHLRSSLDPAATLQELRQLPFLKSRLERAMHILSVLAKLNIEEKARFAAIVSRISQRSLGILCAVVAPLPSCPPLEMCEKFGLALDNLMYLCAGTLIGSYWKSDEEEEFKKVFYSEEHQKKIHDDPCDLLPLFQKKYQEIRREYLRDIAAIQ